MSGYVNFSIEMKNMEFLQTANLFFNEFSHSIDAYIVFLVAQKGTQIYSCCIFLLRFLRIKHQFRTLVDGWHSAFAKIITTKTHSNDILLIINKCRQFTIDCTPSFSFFSTHPI